MDRIRRIEGPAQRNDKELQQYEPYSSCQKKKGQLLFCGPCPIQTGGNAGKEYKYGSAEMGDPAGEEKKGIRFCHVRGIEQEGIAAEIIPNVIQRHDDHYDAPEQIDGFNASFNICHKIKSKNDHGSFGRRPIIRYFLARGIFPAPKDQKIDPDNELPGLSVSNHVDPCYELFNWCKSITQFNKGGRKSSKGHRGMLFGSYDLPNGAGSILEGLFYLHEELFLLSTADLYLRAIAHDDDAAFTPYIFLHMQQIDEKRFMDAQENIAQQPVIVE